MTAPTAERIESAGGDIGNAQAAVSAIQSYLEHRDELEDYEAVVVVALCERANWLMYKALLDIGRRDDAGWEPVPEALGEASEGVPSVDDKSAPEDSAQRQKEVEQYVRHAEEDIDNASKAIELARIEVAKFQDAGDVLALLKIARGAVDAADNDVDLIRETLGMPLERRQS